MHVYVCSVPQQLEFIADDQFSVFESYVLNDLDSECNGRLLKNVIIMWIQEWVSGLKIKLRAIFNLTLMMFSLVPHHSSTVCKWHAHIICMVR